MKGEAHNSQGRGWYRGDIGRGPSSGSRGQEEQKEQFGQQNWHERGQGQWRAVRSSNQMLSTSSVTSMASMQRIVTQTSGLVVVRSNILKKSVDLRVERKRRPTLKKKLKKKRHCWWWNIAQGASTSHWRTRQNNRVVWWTRQNTWVTWIGRLDNWVARRRARKDQIAQWGASKADVTPIRLIALGQCLGPIFLISFNFLLFSFIF